MGYYKDDLGEGKLWNMADSYHQRLDRRLDEANIARSQGDVWTWYRLLHTIIDMIHWRILQEGHEEKEAKMFKSLETVKVMINRVSHQPNAIRKNNVSEIEEQLEKLDRHVCDLLHLYDFLGMQKRLENPSKLVYQKFRVNDKS